MGPPMHRAKLTPHTAPVRLTTAACDGSEQLSLGQRELIASMDGCTVILHDLPWETSPSMTKVRRRALRPQSGDHADLRSDLKCTWKWLSNAFGNPAPRRVEGKTSVGLHIRKPSWLTSRRHCACSCVVFLHLGSQLIHEYEQPGWGDLADDNFPGDFRTDDRSIPIPTANSVLASLEGCIGPLDLRVYM